MVVNSRVSSSLLLLLLITLHVTKSAVVNPKTYDDFSDGDNEDEDDVAIPPLNTDQVKEHDDNKKDELSNTKSNYNIDNLPTAEGDSALLTADATNGLKIGEAKASKSQGSAPTKTTSTNIRTTTTSKLPNVTSEMKNNEDDMSVKMGLEVPKSKQSQTTGEGKAKSTTKMTAKTSTTTTKKATTTTKTTRTSQEIDSDVLHSPMLPVWPSSKEASTSAPSRTSSYVVLLAILLAVLYLVFANKKKIIALLLEGRRKQSGRGSRRHQYKKLDNIAEEEMRRDDDQGLREVIY